MQKPEWATNEVTSLLSGAGFEALAGKVASLSAREHEIEAALRVILLHRKIPYVPLSMSAQAEYERYQNSFGISHVEALKNPEVARFQESLPNGVQMFHIHPMEEQFDGEFGPGWVIVVQAYLYGLFLEEHYTLIRTD